MSEVATPGKVAPAAGFQQRLGLFDATMLVAGSMIGSGIFIVSAEIARDVGGGGWLLAIWAVTGAITVMGALSYAELAAMMPHAGGQYVYLREAYNPLFGFLYGWTLFLVIQTGTIAAVRVAFPKFAGVFAPGLGTDPKAGAWVVLQAGPLTVTGGQVLAVAVIVLLTGVNLLGVQEGKWVQNLFTVAKTLALALLILLGLTVAANLSVLADNFRAPWSPMFHTAEFAKTFRLVPAAGLAALMVAGGAMVGSLFSSDAWNNVTFAAAEVRNPRRTLALSLALGTGMVTLLYLLANVAYLADLPIQGDEHRAAELKAAAETARTPEERAELDRRYREATAELGIAHARDDRVGTAVMDLVFPNVGTRLMALAIMLSTFGCANGLILSGARLYYAMARDDLFFRSVGRLSARGVPAAGLLLQGVWASLLVFTGSYSQLLNYVIFAALLFYVLTAGGLFLLRRSRPEVERPYRVVGYPVVPGLYMGLCAAIMLDLLVVAREQTWPGLLIVLTGIPVYFLWRWRAARPKPVAPGGQ